MNTHDIKLPPLPEPDSYLFQHEDTGLTEYVDSQQVEWGFEKANPRWQKIHGAFTERQMQAYATAAIEAERQSTNEWRKLALQFDSHRMQAIGHLKAIVDHLPVDMQPHIRNFLSAPPDRKSRSEPAKCVGCEGSPSSENNPCGVCGKGVPVGWEFSLNGDWIRTTEPETHKKMGREVRPLFTAPQAQKIPEGYRLQPISEFDAMMNTRTIPEGYALVPIEPTLEMQRAGAQAARKYMQETGGNSPAIIYEAMLEAAPKVKP